MEKRLILFLVLALGIFQAWIIGLRWWQGPPPEVPKVAQQEEVAEPAGEVPPVEAPVEQADVDPDLEAEPPRVEEVADTQATLAEQWVTLGDLSPESPYKLLVTLTNRGAALARAECSDDRFRDLEWRKGYLGHLQGISDLDGRGCLVQVVGPGTPAARAGLRAGDVLTALNDTPLRGPMDLHDAMARTSPRQKVTLHVLREEERLSLDVALTRQPLEIIRPEGADPLSMLMTLQQVDGEQLGVDEEELEGVRMRTMPWEIERQAEDEVVFLYRVKGLEIRKRFHLSQAADEANAGPAYDVKFELSISSPNGAARRVAYRLDGPTGLPTEGWWYANKISRGFFEAAGLRDIVVGFWRMAGLHPKW